MPNHGEDGYFEDPANPRYWGYQPPEPEPEGDPDPTVARYICARCKSELFMEQLFEVRPANHGNTNIRITYTCECSPDVTALYAVYPFHPDGLFRLFGYPVKLPWPASEAKLAASEGIGVEQADFIPLWKPENEQDMKVMHFHMEGVDTAEDFLLFHPGRPGDDERIRKHFRDSNPPEPGN